MPDQAEPPTPAPERVSAENSAKPWLRHLKGDMVGGIAAAIMTIPISMGYGLLALSPFGEAMVPTAILAGLYAPIFGCLVALLLGANTTMIYSPRSIVTFLIGALVLDSIVRSNLVFLQNAAPATQLAVAFMLIFMAGFFQALFGVFRFGELVRYIPAPVIAGFQNAAAILIFFSQLNSMLGLRPQLAVNQGLKLPNWLNPQSVEHRLEPNSQLAQHRSTAVVTAQQVQNHPVQRRFQRIPQQGLHLGHHVLGVRPQRVVLLGRNLEQVHRVAHQRLAHMGSGDPK
ncbi:MAG: hypothetical protein EBT83_09575, partial [Betaproteobacteria bacterium]|nr:hypothetical protein [Betaproteobacteria bacterium]